MLPRPHPAHAPASVRSCGPRAVLAAIDLVDAEARATARTVLAAAERMAEVLDAELHVVHAWQGLGESILSCPVRGMGSVAFRPHLVELQRVRHTEARRFCLRILGPGEWRLHVRHGSPVAVIAEVAAALGGAGLLVLGLPQRRGVAGLFRGRTARHVLDHIECDVLAVRPRST